MPRMKVIGLATPLNSNTAFHLDLHTQSKSTMRIEELDDDNDDTNNSPRARHATRAPPRRKATTNPVTRGRGGLVTLEELVTGFPATNASLRPRGKTIQRRRAEAIAGSKVHDGRIGKHQGKSYANNTVSNNARAHFGDVFIYFDGNNAKAVKGSITSIRAKAHLICGLLTEMLCEIPAALRDFVFASKPIPRPSPGTYAIFMFSEDGLSTGTPALVDIGIVNTWHALLALFHPQESLLVIPFQALGERWWFLRNIKAGNIYHITPTLEEWDERRPSAGTFAYCGLVGVPKLMLLGYEAQRRLDRRNFTLSDMRLTTGLGRLKHRLLNF